MQVLVIRHFGSSSDYLQQQLTKKTLKLHALHKFVARTYRANIPQLQNS